MQISRLQLCCRYAHIVALPSAASVSSMVPTHHLAAFLMQQQAGQKASTLLAHHNSSLQSHDVPSDVSSDIAIDSHFGPTTCSVHVLVAKNSCKHMHHAA